MPGCIASHVTDSNAWRTLCSAWLCTGQRGVCLLQWFAAKMCSIAVGLIALCQITSTANPHWQTSCSNLSLACPLLGADRQ